MTRRTAFGAPSTRLRRSVPNRASSGPSGAALQPLDERRGPWRNPSSNASHGLRSRHRSGTAVRTVPAGDPERGHPRADRGRAGWPAGPRAGTRGGARDSTGAARRSPSIRARIAASPTSWRSVCSPRMASTSSSPPSGTGKRSRSRRRTSAAPTSRAARSRSAGPGSDGLVLRAGPAGRGTAGSGSGPDRARRPRHSTSSIATVRPHVAHVRREQVGDREPQAGLAVRRRRRATRTPHRGGAGPAVGGRARRAAASAGSLSRLKARRWRSIAARATQPPRPWRSATMSPGSRARLEPRLERAPAGAAARAARRRAA